MAHTLLTLIIVNLLLLFWLYKLLHYCFCLPFWKWNSQKNTPVPSKQATILSINTLKKGKSPLLEAQIVFENFSGHLIHSVVRFRDKAPHLNRFQKDGKMTIILDAHKKPRNPVVPAFDEYGISFALMLCCTVLTLTYITGYYYIMGEALSRITDASAYYGKKFEGSLMGNGILFLAVLFVLVAYLLTKNGFLGYGKTASTNWELLYLGIGAKATIQKSRNIRVFDKSDSMVAFTYIFKDNSGQSLKGTDSIVVKKMEADALSDSDTLEIMYLPHDSTTSRMTKNLESQQETATTSYVMMAILAVFSGIILARFCLDLL